MKPVLGVATLALLIWTGSAGSREGPSNQGKTREQTRQELVQAYKEGVLPFRRSEYPPTAASMKKNREAYARTHPGATSKQEVPSGAKSR